MHRVVLSPAPPQPSSFLPLDGTKNDLALEFCYENPRQLASVVLVGGGGGHFLVLWNPVVGLNLGSS